MEDRPFEAIAIYDDRVSGENPLYVPVLWQGYFQEPVDVASLRRDMDTGLVLDERWLRLPQSQALSPDFCPGLIIFCADRVSAAMARRNWQESLTKDNQTTSAIIDPRVKLSALWVRRRPCGGILRLSPTAGDLGDISAVLEGLSSGPYASVNGRQAWDLFGAILGWTLRNSSGVGEGIHKPVVKSDGEFLNIGIGGGQ